MKRFFYEIIIVVTLWDSKSVTKWLSFILQMIYILKYKNRNAFVHSAEVIFILLFHVNYFTNYEEK
jgi:hypothetical protein